MLRLASQPVKGAANPCRSAGEDLGIDHGHSDIRMIQQVLNRPDVPAVRKYGGSRKGRNFGAADALLGALQRSMKHAS